jgi:uncharacterized protein (DUF433 family)
VEPHEGAYRVAGTRVSLDSLVYAFWDGKRSETIAQSFPTLTLEQVYGAIAFYLGHCTEIDAYLQQGQRDYETRRQAARDADPMFYQKMAEARRQMQSTVSQPVGFARKRARRVPCSTT